MATTDTNAGNQRKVPPTCPIMLTATGDNLIIWKIVMESLMRTQLNVWEVITKKLVKPVIPKDKTPTTEQEKTIKAVEEATLLANGMILTAIHPAIIESVYAGVDLATAYAPRIWDDIQRYCTTRTGASEQVAFSRFVSFAYDTGKAVEENVQQFSSIVQTIKLSGANIPDTLIQARILESLPKSWDPFKQSWTAVRPGDYEMLKEQVIAEGLRRKAADNQLDQTTALFTRFNMRNGGGNHRYRPQQHHHHHQQRPQHQQYQPRPHYSGWPPRNDRQGGHKPNFNKRIPRCTICYKNGHKSYQCRQRIPQNQHDRTEAHHVEAEALNVDEVDYEEEGTTWVADSGSTSNICNDIKLFEQYTPFDKPREVKIGGKQVLPAYGIGTVPLWIHDRGQWKICRLTEVLYVSRMRRCLISIAKATDANWEVTCRKDAIILRKGNVQVKADRVGDLYCLRAPSFSPQVYNTEKMQNAPAKTATKQQTTNATTTDTQKPTGVKANIEKQPTDIATEATQQSANPQASNATPQPEEGGNVTVNNLQNLHALLGHIGKSKVAQFLKREGIEYSGGEAETCEPCITSKQRRESFRTKPPDAIPQELGHVSTDLCTPTEPTRAGNRHFMAVTERHSGYRKLYLLKNKGQAAECL